MKNLSIHVVKSYILVLTLIFSSLYTSSQTIFNISSVDQISFEHPIELFISPIIEVKYAYNLPVGSTPKYLNMFFMTPFSTNVTWGIQNLLLEGFPSQRELTSEVLLDKSGVVAGVEIPGVDIAYFVTDTIFFQPIPISPTQFQPFLCGFSLHQYGGYISLIPDSLRTFAITIPPNIVFNSDTLRSVTRGCNMPNLELDSSKHNPGTEPGYAGDWNACVPTACANSFEWLEDRHPEINTGLSHREKLKEFSKLMKRRNDQGVYTDTMIKGKMEFIEKYKLPVSVKYQSVWKMDSCITSFTNDYNHCAKNQSRHQNDTNNLFSRRLDWNWIFQEMQNGEDVEMNYFWGIQRISDDSILSSGKHSVVLSGIQQHNGVKRITIKDDESQGDSTGLREQPMVVDTMADGSLVLRERTDTFRIRREVSPGVFVIDTVKMVCYIDDVVSESYDSTVTYPSGIQSRGIPDDQIMVMNNPMGRNDVAQIKLNLNKPTQASVFIIDLHGRTVYSYGERKYSTGLHNLTWDGTISGASHAPAGVYFVIMITPENNYHATIIRQ